MSRNPGLEPHCPQAAELGAIETQIIPRARDSAASRFAEPFRRRPGRWLALSSSSTRWTG